MAELAVKTKKLDFHLEQVQDFTPTPMTISTETWYTGYNPYTLEPVFSAKTPREKLAQRQFFFWYKPEERHNIERELRRIGRADLIPQLYEGKSVVGYRFKRETVYSNRPVGSLSDSVSIEKQHHTTDKRTERKSFNPNFTYDNHNRRKHNGQRAAGTQRGRYRKDK